MKNCIQVLRCFTVVFMLTFIGKPLSAQSSKDSSLLAKFDFAIALHGGATFKNHEKLSQLIYGNNGTLGTGIYYNSGFGFHIRSKKLHEIIYAHRTITKIKPVNGGEVEVQDGSVSVSLGYEFNPGSKFKVIPNLGLVISATEIIYIQNSGYTQNASTYLTRAGDTHRLISERYYAKAGLLAFYTIEGPRLKTFFPMDIGLNLEFAQAVNQTEWKRGIDTEVDGPNIFDNSFYAGLTVAWWF